MAAAPFKSGLDELVQADSGNLVLARRTADDEPLVQGRLFAFQSEPASQRALVDLPLDRTITPAVVGVGDQVLHAVLRGIDRRYYYRSWSNVDWTWSQTGWVSLGGTFRSLPVVVQSDRAAPRIEVFGLGDSGELLQKTLLLDDPAHPRWVPDQQQWVDWGGSFSGYPAVVTPTSGRIVIFATGTATLRSDYPASSQPASNVWWKEFRSTSASGALQSSDARGWGTLPVNDAPLTNITASLAAASWNPRRIDLLCVGAIDASKGPRLLHRYATLPSGGDSSWDAGRWTAWRALGSGFIGSPVAASTGDGRLDLFGLEFSQDKPRLLYQGCRPPSDDLVAEPAAWQTTWQPSGDDPIAWLVGPPAIANWSDGSAELFAPRVDGATLHTTWGADATPTWNLLPGNFPF